jgi:hypothetical protein
MVVFFVGSTGCLWGRDGFIRADGDQRAAFELKCPREQLKIVEMNESTVGVEGCGTSAVYKLVQTGRGVSDWVRN